MKKAAVFSLCAVVLLWAGLALAAPGDVTPALADGASGGVQTVAEAEPVFPAGLSPVEPAAPAEVSPDADGAAALNGASGADDAPAEQEEDNKAYVRGSDASGADIYAEDIHTLVDPLVASPMLPLFFEGEVQNLVQFLADMDIRDVRLRVDEKGHLTLLFTPARPVQLETLLAAGGTARELLPVFGLTEDDCLPDMKADLDCRLEVVQQDSSVLRLQGHDAYFAHAGGRVLFGDHGPNVSEALKMLQEGVIPFSEGLEGDAPLRACLRKELDADNAAASDRIGRFTFGATPVSGGWVVRFHTNLNELQPGQTPPRPVDLSKLLVCDSNPPFFILGYGKEPYVAALLDSLVADGSLSAERRALLEQLDCALFAAGGGQFVAAPLRLPVLTLGVKGEPDALQRLMAEIAGTLPGQETPAAGWDKVTLHSLQQQIGMPVNILLARSGNVLVGGLMNPQALTRPLQDARAILTAALDGSGLVLPKAMSSVTLLNTRQYFQELQAILNDPLMGTLLEAARPGRLAIVQQFLASTPPVTSVVAWLDNPDSTNGVIYFAVTSEDTTPFWQSVKALSELNN